MQREEVQDKHLRRDLHPVFLGALEAAPLRGFIYGRAFGAAERLAVS